MNKGITWDEETLFEYLENPKKVRTSTYLLHLRVDPYHSFREVHPRHKDGLRWFEEREGPERPHHLAEDVGALLFMFNPVAPVFTRLFRPHKSIYLDRMDGFPNIYLSYNCPLPPYYWLLGSSRLWLDDNSCTSRHTVYLSAHAPRSSNRLIDIIILVLVSCRWKAQSQLPCQNFMTSGQGQPIFTTSFMILVMELSWGEIPSTRDVGLSGPRIKNLHATQKLGDPPTIDSWGVYVEGYYY